jgi:hypothetical protein
MIKALKKYRQQKGRTYELCVGCGSTTEIPRTMSLSIRPNYIPGKGQLCPKCWQVGGTWK